MFDVFTATLQCPACGAVVTDAEIQTHIRNVSADSSALGVGFEFDASDLDAESITGSGYELIDTPGADGSIRLLDVWICPQCQTEQWAVVEIVGHRIRAIEAVKLDGETLASANFISEVNAELLADALLDGPPPANASSVDILRRTLP